MLKVRKEFKTFLKEALFIVYFFIFSYCCLISLGGFIMYFFTIQGIDRLAEQALVGVVFLVALAFVIGIILVVLELFYKTFFFIFEKSK